MLQATFDAALISHATELKRSEERSDALLEEIEQERLKGKQLTGELEAVQVTMPACCICSSRKRRRKSFPAGPYIACPRQDLTSSVGACKWTDAHRHLTHLYVNPIAHC